MATYLLRPGLQILLWSIFVTLFFNHFILSLNPFLGFVFSILLLIALIAQLILLRKNGLVYIGIFLLGLVVLTTVLLYLDSRIFNYPKRYYSVTFHTKNR